VSQQCDQIIAGLREVNPYEICSYCGRLISEHKSKLSETCEVCGELCCEFSLHEVEVCYECGDKYCFHKDSRFDRGAFCADCGQWFCPSCEMRMETCEVCGGKFCHVCFKEHQKICEHDDGR